MRGLILMMVVGLAACSPQPATDNAAASVTPELDGGIVTRKSAHSVPETMARLEAAVADKGLAVVAKVDHAANATKAGLDMPPAMVLIFGNPQLGTPLMRAAPDMALDLPQRIAVFTARDGSVMAAYHDPARLAARHGIAGQDETTAKIATALDGLTTAATN